MAQCVFMLAHNVSPELNPYPSLLSFNMPALQKKMAAEGSIVSSVFFPTAAVHQLLEPKGPKTEYCRRLLPGLPLSIDMQMLYMTLP